MSLGKNVVVLIAHATDAGEDSCVFVALDARGRPVGRKVVSLEGRIGHLATMAATGGRALAMLVDREEERLRDGEELRLHDRPEFFDLGEPPGVEPKVVGSWRDVEISHAAAASVGAKSAWIVRRVKWTASGTTSPTVEWGWATRAKPPALRGADLPSAVMAHAPAGEQIVALLGDGKELGLYGLPAKGEPRRIADVARARSKTEIVDARVLPLRDGWALVWYAEAKGSASGAGLWARTCSKSFDDLGEVVHVARDDDARWNEWRADDVGDGVLVLFGSGEPGDPVKQIRWQTRRDLAKDAKRFAGRLPVAVVVTSAGVLAITETFSGGGRKTTISARSIDV